MRRRGNGEIEYLSPTEVMIVRNPQNAKQETLGNMTLIHALRAIANRKTPDGEKITVACAANIARAARIIGAQRVIQVHSADCGSARFARTFPGALRASAV